jgi:hypothetical protein
MKSISSIYIDGALGYSGKSGVTKRVKIATIAREAVRHRRKYVKEGNSAGTPSQKRVKRTCCVLKVQLSIKKEGKKLSRSAAT